MQKDSATTDLSSLLPSLPLSKEELKLTKERERKRRAYALKTDQPWRDSKPPSQDPRTGGGDT